MARSGFRSAKVAGAVCVLGILGLAGPISAALKYTGMNLTSPSFANADRQNEIYPYTWYYPTQATVDYFMGKGMNTFRTSVLWDRLQPTINGDLSTVEFGRLDAFINATTAKGAYIVLDPHDSARFKGTLIGTTEVPLSAFGDFWGKVADHYKGNDHVIFGLTNEPHDMQVSTWVDAANLAISAIRATGAKNLILVPGDRWSGAWSWNTADSWGESNASALKKIVDPGKNFAIEVHQYLDQWSSGTSAEIYGNDPDLGVKRLQDFTKWLKDNHLQGFLGEFGVANSTIGPAADQIGDELLTRMLTYMQDNGDVWQGWTWFLAGGCWDPNYMFLAEPTNLGQPNQLDRPVMSVLEHFTAVPEPTTLGTAVLGSVFLLARKRPNSNSSISQSNLSWLSVPPWKHGGVS